MHRSIIDAYSPKNIYRGKIDTTAPVPYSHPDIQNPTPKASRLHFSTFLLTPFHRPTLQNYYVD